jgi:excisionase family DNA binding protein
MALVSTREAAKQLKLSLRRVQAMIKTGLLPATKIGRDWLIETDDIEREKQIERKPERPRKSK